MSESVGLLVALTAGVLSFLSPCVLPLVPSYLSFVTGMSLEDLQEGVDRKATLLHSLLFVAGFSIIFITLGASASFLGAFLRYYEVWIARIGGAVIIVLGLHLMGVLRIAPADAGAEGPRERQARRISRNDRRGSRFRGRLDALHRPVLGAILTLAGTQGHRLGGRKPVERLLVGAGHPVSDFRAGPGLVPGAFSRFRRFLPLVEKASGVILILLGLLLMTGSFTVLSSYLTRFTPAWVLERI